MTVSSEDASMSGAMIAMCKKVHTGPRWWLGEDPNVKLYNGEGK